MNKFLVTRICIKKCFMKVHSMYLRVYAIYVCHIYLITCNTNWYCRNQEKWVLTLHINSNFPTVFHDRDELITKGAKCNKKEPKAKSQPIPNLSTMLYKKFSTICSFLFTDVDHNVTFHQTIIITKTSRRMVPHSISKWIMKSNRLHSFFVPILVLVAVVITFVVQITIIFIYFLLSIIMIYPPYSSFISNWYSTRFMFTSWCYTCIILCKV